MNADSKLVNYGVQRLSLAGAVFTDSAICVSTRPPADPGFLAGIFDELRMDSENRLAWLGRPLGEAKHLAEREPNLLETTPPEKWFSGERLIIRRDSWSGTDLLGFPENDQPVLFLIARGGRRGSNGNDTSTTHAGCRAALQRSAFSRIEPIHCKRAARSGQIDVRAAAARQINQINLRRLGQAVFGVVVLSITNQPVGTRHFPEGNLVFAKEI